ncbi:unnamed protein product [Closterium sp. Naga37s-1]|nr:unnamed protein product [Closterium sp. Naga37s-1]
MTLTSTSQAQGTGACQLLDAPTSAHRTPLRPSPSLPPSPYLMLVALHRARRPPFRPSHSLALVASPSARRSHFRPTLSLPPVALPSKRRSPFRTPLSLPPVTFPFVSSPFLPLVPSQSPSPSLPVALAIPPLSPRHLPPYPPSHSLLPLIPFPAPPHLIPCFRPSRSLLPPIPFPASSSPLPYFPPYHSLLPPIPIPASPPSRSLLPSIPFPASPHPLPCFPQSPSLLPPIQFPASPHPIPVFPPSRSQLPPIPFPASPHPLPCSPPSPSLLPPIPFPASPHPIPCFPPFRSHHQRGERHTPGEASLSPYAPPFPRSHPLPPPSHVPSHVPLPIVPSLLPPIPFPTSPHPLPCFPPSPSQLPPIPFPASPPPFPASPHPIPFFPPSLSLLPLIPFPAPPFLPVPFSLFHAIEDEPATATPLTERYLPTPLCKMGFSSGGTLRQPLVDTAFSAAVQHGQCGVVWEEGGKAGRGCGRIWGLAVSGSLPRSVDAGGEGRLAVMMAAAHVKAGLRCCGLGECRAVQGKAGHVAVWRAESHMLQNTGPIAVAADVSDYAIGSLVSAALLR